MRPIADSAYAHDVELWVAGGDQAVFTRALAAYEIASWTTGRAGAVDESMYVFDDREWWIARRLANQGHNVVALPPRSAAGLRSPDAAVSGLLVEFKTYTGSDPRQLLSRIARARPQADRVVVGVEGQWDKGLVQDVFRVGINSARRRGMQAVMFIGDYFQFEWGAWNTRLTASISATHPR